MARNIIGVSMGDPAGIGPEVFIKAMHELDGKGASVPVLVGDLPVLQRNFNLMGTRWRCNIVKTPSDIKEGFINLYPAGIVSSMDFPVSSDSALCGRASFSYVSKALSLWKKGFIQGIVTLPISKKSWHLAGHLYSGHTEFFSHQLGVKKFAMIMAAGNTRVLLVTAHIPLREVSGTLDVELIVEKISTGHAFICDMGVASPVIYVAALNPHAGEGEIMGDEEKKVIVPAMEALNKKGIICKGPFPADSIFRKASSEKADLIAAMYHDQALIPLKTSCFKGLVNCTAGLGLVRTSPGHGTGYDIAYKNCADPASFIAAYRMAETLVSKKVSPQ